MDINKIGLWMHSAFAATSIAFFFTMIGKEQSIENSVLLLFCTMFYVISLILNSIWAFLYKINFSEFDVSKKLRSNCFFKGLDNMASWSFIFATLILLFHFILVLGKKFDF